MKIKENLVLRQVADTWVVLPIAEATANFDGMLRLNETGAILWQALEKGSSREALAELLTGEFHVSVQQALEDADAFIQKLMEIGCIESE